MVSHHANRTRNSARAVVTGHNTAAMPAQSLFGIPTNFIQWVDDEPEDERSCWRCRTHSELRFRVLWCTGLHRALCALHDLMALPEQAEANGMAHRSLDNFLLAARGTTTEHVVAMATAVYAAHRATMALRKDRSLCGEKLLRMACT